MRAGADGTSLTAAERVAWLRLIRTDNVGPQTNWQLLPREGSADAAHAALPHQTPRIAAAPRIPSRAEAEDEIAGLEALGGRLVASVEADYPALLKYISGAPPLLALVGRTRPDLQRTVGIVGARNASTAGQKLTRQLATELGEAGYVVVSGLARGIDAAAHRASLATGTVAVLAGGMDRIYPEENVPLAAEIVAQGGMLVSEMRLGWEPRARDFPRRNRLVAGRLADHGPHGARTGPRGVRGARLAARPAGRGLQCADPAGRAAGDRGCRHHRRAG